MPWPWWSNVCDDWQQSGGFRLRLVESIVRQPYNDRSPEHSDFREHAMNRKLLTPLALLVGIMLLTANRPAHGDAVKEKIVLFNGQDLTNFYTFLKGKGKNNDPDKVFTVKDGMICVSGKEFGGITTEKEFENYRLVVEFKWGEETWAPRKDRARDSGILLHCVGKDGARGGIWMESVECQLIEGGTGDFILVSGAAIPEIDVRAEKRGNEVYYDPKAEPQRFKGRRINWWGRDPAWKDVVGFRGKQDVENPVGQWNTLECVCQGGAVTNILNGKVVNEGTNSTHTKGKILFQSEGAELYFRKIELQPLSK